MLTNQQTQSGFKLCLVEEVALKVRAKMPPINEKLNELKQYIKGEMAFHYDKINKNHNIINDIISNFIIGQCSAQSILNGLDKCYRNIEDETHMIESHAKMYKHLFSEEYEFNPADIKPEKSTNYNEVALASNLHR